MGNNDRHHEAVMQMNNVVMTVGIDLSMNASGIAVVITENCKDVISNYTVSNPKPLPLSEEELAKIAKRKRKPKEQFVFKSNKILHDHYYLLVSNDPKSPKKYSRSVEVMSYGREYDESDTYAITDMSKILSAKKLAGMIKRIIIANMKKYHVDECTVKMEGSVMASSFSKQKAKLNDLTAFNSIIKLMLITTPEISKIGIIAPTELKKLATGAGNAKKEQMIAAFKELKEDRFDYNGKIDDVVDAWYLASCVINEDNYYDKLLVY